MRRFILYLTLLIVLPLVIFPQEDSVQTKKTFLQRLDSIRNWKLETGRSTLTPFIAPSYSPEMELTLTAGGLFTFKMGPNSPMLSRSSIPFSIGYSTNGSLLVSIRANIYGKNDKLRISGEYWIKDMPDNYWGVGYDNGRYTPVSDSTTNYHRTWKQFKFKIAYEVVKNFFLGLNYDRNSTNAKDINPLMALDENVLKYGTEIKNQGVGMVWRFDSRDFPENAYKGVLLEINGATYGKAKNSDYAYRVTEFDYRQYQQIVRRGSTLAWQFKTRVSSEDVPWSELSMIGTPNDLRGYPWGQYRDKSAAFLLAEYRYMVPRKTPTSSGEMCGPFGFVVWGGTGSVAEKIWKMHQWLPNAGVGLRFELQPRMNIRIDYGVGVNSSAFYISFNEAF